MEFHEKLRAIIKEEGISQRQFSDLTGVPLRSIENYLSKQQEPKIQTVSKIVSHITFKKYTLWLMTGDTHPESGQICPEFSNQSMQEISQPTKKKA